MIAPWRAVAAALMLLVVAGACSADGGKAPSPFDGPKAAGFTLLETTADSTLCEAFVSWPVDGLNVRGRLFFDPRGDAKRPAVLFNHGGVSGVSADMKKRSRELAGTYGFIVLAPSYRGEDGSDGRVEVAAGEVDDVLAAAALLARWPRVDADRILLAGSSHGALISMLAAAREPERFRAVAAACGVMDVVSWYAYLVENGFDVGDSLSVAVYGHGPEDRPDAFRERQAVRVADRITIPVLLQQGLADRTVPPEQARLMKAVLKKAGNTEVFLREYPLLGHAFWFWDDPTRHTPEELEQARAAWDDLVLFLQGSLDEPPPRE